MRLFQKKTEYRKDGIALLSGMGIGALLMYVFDPARGARRRALARDKATHLARKTGERIEEISKDLGNRQRDVIAKSQSLLQDQPAPDSVLDVGEAAGRMPAFEGRPKEERP